MLRDMTEGKPLQLMIKFSIPLVIGNVLGMLYQLINSVIVGQMLGVSAFASVGATVSISWMVLSAVLGITFGFGAVFAHHYGAKDMDGLRRTFATAIFLTIILGMVVGCIGGIGSRTFLVALNTPMELLDGSTIYLQVLLFGMPITFFNNTLMAMLRALGDSKTPLKAMILASILNIFLDFVLVLPFGLTGVACATLIAQLSAIIFCGVSLHKTGVLKGMKIKMDAVSAKTLLRLGLPLGFRNGIIEISGLIVHRYINSYGMVFVAGIAAANRMYSILMIVAFAVEAAVATFVAQNYGAKKVERIKEGVNVGAKIAFASVAVIMAFSLLCGKWILSLMIDGDSAQAGYVLETAVRQLWIAVIGLPLLYMIFVYRAAIQGMGRPLIPVITGFVEMATRIVSVIFLSRLWGEWGVMISGPLGWLPAAVMLSVSFFIIYKRFSVSATNPHG